MPLLHSTQLSYLAGVNHKYRNELPYELSFFVAVYSCEVSFWSNRRREASSLSDVAQKACAGGCKSRSGFIYTYINWCVHVLDSDNWLHNKTMARVCHVVSLHLLSIFSLQWLTRDFKYETFHDQWIPLNSVSEVSIREQEEKKKITSQKRMAQDWLDPH